jgi:hypothetical protein
LILIIRFLFWDWWQFFWPLNWFLLRSTSD